MNNQQNQCFENIKTNQLVDFPQEEYLLQNYFSSQPKAATNLCVTLWKNSIIVESIKKKELMKFQISFSLKFQILYLQKKNVHSPKIGLVIINNEQNFYLYSESIVVLQTWITFLAKKINQVGFHQLFKPIKKLGKGNFASVYETQRITDLKRFAVKAFSKASTFAAKNGKQSLLNEISIMRTLDHQNILKLDGVFQSANSIYVVFQIIEGKHLFAKIQQKQGYFTQKQIFVFMIGFLKGLLHLHSNRIMHRDLKPQNIMLKNDYSMEPVIVDFGLSTNVDIDKYLFYRCGTPGYVAPEIVNLGQNSHVEPECDIFSAGVIFHILLTRKPLFQGTTYDQVYKNNKQMKFDLDKDQYNMIDEEAMSLLKKMLEINPKQRITAQQALQHNYFTKNHLYQELINQKLLASPTSTTCSNKIKFPTNY